MSQGWPVTALCIGRAALLPGGQSSAIAKTAVTGPVSITYQGLTGDQQVDTRHHGGPDMAVHLYPMVHRRFWHDRIGDHPALALPGGFGSNLGVEEIAEDAISLGERFQLGSALLEVSQPRMPCATIERRFERKGMVEAIMRSGRSGWYFRVIEEGMAEAGDWLRPIPGTGTGITISTIFSQIAGPAADSDRVLIEQLASTPLLGKDWRKRAHAILAQSGN